MNPIGECVSGIRPWETSLGERDAMFGRRLEGTHGPEIVFSLREERL